MSLHATHLQGQGKHYDCILFTVVCTGVCSAVKTLLVECALSSLLYWWFCNSISCKEKQLPSPYLEGSTGADIKERFLPVRALMTRLCPHHCVHIGNASHSQKHVEGACEKYSQTHIPTGTHRHTQPHTNKWLETVNCPWAKTDCWVMLN